MMNWKYIVSDASGLISGFGSFNIKQAHPGGPACVDQIPANLSSDLNFHE